MEDLLKSQIKASCNLALPNGLKELMADISREVLRAQPSDLCRFITEYLSILLVTRENLYIASRVCNEVCDSRCHQELYDELRNIGLQHDNAEMAESIIMEYFHKDKVNEGKLLVKLMSKMDLDEELLPSIQAAVRIAFLRHQASRAMELETLSGKGLDEVSRAAAHTLQLYRTVDTTDQQCDTMAEKIQVPTAADETATSWNAYKISVGTISSTSLAGSYLKLPKYKPYSAIDADQLIESEETSGREHAYIDYTRTSENRDKDKIVTSCEEKRISFEDPHNRDIDDDSDGSIEEVIEFHNRSYEVYNERSEDVDEIEKVEVIDDTDDEIESIVSSTEI